MDLQLTDKRALVLGGGGGIGGGIARQIAAEGAAVAVADLNLDAAQNTSDEITNSGLVAVAVELALGDPGAERRGLESAVQQIGPIDILVNNTGGPPSTAASGVDQSLWAQFFESMVLSVIRLTDLVLPAMQDAGWGRVITSASSGILEPIAGLAMSNTLRSSLVGWSKSLAGEAGPGITSNVVIPGRIASQRAIEMDQIRAAAKGVGVEAISEEYFRRIPARRYGSPEEYGDVVAFLASPRAAYVNGSIVRVDGGMIASV